MSTTTRVAERNWSRNVRYGASRIEHPQSIPAAQQIVADTRHVHALGTRHAFNDSADGPNVLIALDQVPAALEIDAADRTATVGGGTPMGDLAVALDAAGWALHNMASLPHISIAGAVATGTHGSGDLLGSLATAVRALEFIGPDGQLRSVRADDPDFAGSVVAFGALGIVTRVTLAIEPTYQVRQDVYAGLPWQAAIDNLDAVTGAAYSVSLFTDWLGDTVGRAFLKTRITDGAGASAPPADLFGARASGTGLSVFGETPNPNMTQQGGVPGAWWQRLPHFRMEFTPSNGEELQTEYLVPRPAARAALEAVRAMGERIAPALLISEIRTMAGDDLWLSGAYGGDTVGIHFTWQDRPDLVLPLLAQLEQRLLPLGARPHWGKLFDASGTRLRDHYPRWTDFTALRARVDPDAKFGNAFLERIFGPGGSAA